MTTHAIERTDPARGARGGSTRGVLLVAAAALLGIVAARVLEWRSRAHAR